MITALIGEIESTGSNPLVVFAGDVGYGVSVPPSYFGRIPLSGKTRFHIHTTVRDDAIELFGFVTSSELRLFELLLTVRESVLKPHCSLSIKGSIPSFPRFDLPMSRFSPEFPDSASKMHSESS